jgi:hypothetical protein
MAVVTAGKEAIYDALDAATGKYLFNGPRSANAVTAINPGTGAKTINPKTALRDGETKLVCPGK